MDVMISNQSKDPIYQQIIDQIKNQIISEKLEAGQMLPSIRYLARQLRISVITVKRAYDDLEKEGFIETVSGKGSFVARCDTEAIKKQQKQLLRRALAQNIDAAKQNQVKLEELITMVRSLYEGREG